MASGPEPFRVRIEQAVLDDLRRRLQHTRWPAEIAGAGWARGAPRALVESLAASWRDTFDWRRAEERINRVAQFTHPVDGALVHFVHERGRGPRPLPLLIGHGWPGSFLEMLDLVPWLTDPASHGASADDAFDVVVPSMPGYGFSPATTEADQLYHEASKVPVHLRHGERVAVPCGIARFPKEEPMPPRSWVERGYDLRRWTELPRGGHFAAMEQPELLARDVREFFRPLRTPA